MRCLRYAAVTAALLLSPVLCVDSLVDLGYSKYQGKALNNGITQWLSVRYAAPPVGQLRFSPPQDPDQTDEVQDASDWGLICPKTGAESSHIGDTESEDCLFINVFAPSDADEGDNLPVFFYVQGGGFNENSNAFINGSSLITASGMNMILVTLNYRVGPYGFMVDGDKLTPNIGILDQRKGLEWTQKYISKFGGDPGHVTLGGDSAGAASVSLHLSAYGGTDSGLFHAAAAESVSFATTLTVAEAVYQYENFAVRLGCSGSDPIACLRSKTTVELQDANYNIPFPGAPAAPLYMWDPVIDGSLIPDYTYNLFQEGKFIKVPAIFGDDTNGGTVFTPSNTSTLAESNVFLKTQFPWLTLDQIGTLNDLYPNPNDTCPNAGCYWRQVSNVYGQMRYMCPGLYITSSFTRYGMPNSWSYLYNVEDPTLMAEGYGVPHTVEVNAIFGPENAGGTPPASYLEGQENAPVIPVIQGYWSSFIRCYDPNKHRYPGSAKWETWTDNRKQRLVFETGGKTVMQKITRDLQKKCSYFASIGASVRQ